MCRGWSMAKRVKIIFKVVNIWTLLSFTMNKVNELREANPILFTLNLVAYLLRKNVLFLSGPKWWEFMLLVFKYILIF